MREDYQRQHRGDESRTAGHEGKGYVEGTYIDKIMGMRYSFPEKEKPGGNRAIQKVKNVGWNLEQSR